MGQHVKSYVFTHLKYWDLYLALIVSIYVSLIFYIAFMWGLDGYYDEVTGKPLTAYPAAFLKPICLISGIVSVIFVFTNLSLVSSSKLKSKLQNALLLLLYQVISFVCFVGISYVLLFIIRKYLIG